MDHPGEAFTERQRRHRGLDDRNLDWEPDRAETRGLNILKPSKVLVMTFSSLSRCVDVCQDAGRTDFPVLLVRMTSGTAAAFPRPRGDEDGEDEE